jgi:hypothetical protein
VELLDSGNALHQGETLGVCLHLVADHVPLAEPG